MFSDPKFWVAVSFILFMALIIRFKVPSRIATALDARGQAIAKEIEEARKLRDEAQALLASYQRKQRDAEKEAQAIVTEARAESERLAAETRKSLEALIARRSKMAEDKIAQAEAQAVAEVRALAADVAVGAARRLIAERVGAADSNALIDTAIRELRTKIN